MCVCVCQVGFGVFLQIASSTLKGQGSLQNSTARCRISAGGVLLDPAEIILNKTWHL